VITGSEDSYIYIYDILTAGLVKKYKTPQKCVNLVKPLPNCDYSFVFSGLENTSIYVWNNTKVISKETCNLIVRRVLNRTRNQIIITTLETEIRIKVMTRVPTRMTTILLKKCKCLYIV
jgi:WD40 repeat protein